LQLLDCSAGEVPNPILIFHANGLAECVSPSPGSFVTGDVEIQHPLWPEVSTLYFDAQLVYDDTTQTSELRVPFEETPFNPEPLPAGTMLRITFESEPSGSTLQCESFDGFNVITFAELPVASPLTIG
jgi:hypothetical protein